MWEYSCKYSFFFLSIKKKLYDGDKWWIKSTAFYLSCDFSESIPHFVQVFYITSDIVWYCLLSTWWVVWNDFFVHEKWDLWNHLCLSPGNEVSLFSLMSPPELLDRHLRLGSDIHAKELTKIPLTSKECTNWTHFGGWFSQICHES